MNGKQEKEKINEKASIKEEREHVKKQGSFSDWNDRSFDFPG